MIKKTPLYQQHLDAGAKLVDFAGWQMPLHYGSQLEEHQAVRQHAGVFDVSHMAIVDISGARVVDFLRYLLANNIDKLTDNGQALYSCLLADDGGILDDLLCYRLNTQHYRLVVNAARCDSDLAWLNQQAIAHQVQIRPRVDLAMLAIQGPKARTLFSQSVQGVKSIDDSAVADLRRFSALIVDDWLIARTGYTGEDGLEILLPHPAAQALWQRLLAGGVMPCGLGARDTLRLEAGLNLYGSDMDAQVTPLESNLAWTVSFTPLSREFIGKQALLAAQAAGLTHKLTGIKLTGRGVLRQGQVVKTNAGAGVITSGSFSPILGVGIGLARVPIDATGEVQVMIRNQAVLAEWVKPPFI